MGSEDTESTEGTAPGEPTGPLGALVSEVLPVPPAPPEQAARVHDGHVRGQDRGQVRGKADPEHDVLTGQVHVPPKDAEAEPDEPDEPAQPSLPPEVSAAVVEIIEEHIAAAMAEQREGGQKDGKSDVLLPSLRPADVIEQAHARVQDRLDAAAAQKAAAESAKHPKTP